MKCLFQVHLLPAVCSAAYYVTWHVFFFIAFIKGHALNLIQGSGYFEFIKRQGKQLLLVFEVKHYMEGDLSVAEDSFGGCCVKPKEAHGALCVARTLVMGEPSAVSALNLVRTSVCCSGTCICCCSWRYLAECDLGHAVCPALGSAVAEGLPAHPVAHCFLVLCRGGPVTTAVSA